MNAPFLHTPAPPCNPDAEQALLGAILINNAAFAQVSGFLKAEHFHEELHKRTYSVITDLLKAGKIANPVTLRTYLGNAEIDEGWTIPQYLAMLAREATTILNAEGYGRAIYDMAQRRSLIETLGLGLKIAYDAPVASTAAIQIEALQESLYALQADSQVAKDTRRVAGESATGLIDRIRRVQSGEIKALSITTGIPDLDHATGGFRGGEFWILAGRPGMGKTALLVSLARATARAGNGVLAFELEIPEVQITARSLAEVSYAPHRPLGYGTIMKALNGVERLSETDFDRLDQARDHIAQLPLIYDVAERLTVAQIGTRVRRERERMAKVGRRLGVVFVDYLKFVNATDRYRGQRVYEVGEISAGLKELAKAEDLTVVLLAQLNRSVESRDDKRPQLSDLRESGDLEADADVVGLLYREAYYLSENPKYRRGDPDAHERMNEVRNRLELILAKARSGATRTVELWCDMEASAVAAQARGAR